VIRRYSTAVPVVSWVIYGVGATYCVASILGMTGYPPTDGVVPGDAYNYWEGLAYSDPHYRYSPAFYWVTAPLRWLPFEWFVAIWTGLHLVALAWLAPWTIILAFDDVIRGNINSFLAIAVVLAATGKPWTWTASALTKVTLVVGVLHHVARRDWTAVIIAFASTAMVIAVTWPFGMWPEWFDSLRAGVNNYDTIDFLAPLPVRLAIGAILCLASARWIWLLPLGMVAAMPGLWPSALALLAAIPRLVRAARTTSANQTTSFMP
jgi:hypothetical protein